MPADDLGGLTLYVAFYHLLVSGVQTEVIGVQHRLIGLSGGGLGGQESGRCFKLKTETATD